MEELKSKECVDPDLDPVCYVHKNKLGLTNNNDFDVDSFTNALSEINSFGCRFNVHSSVTS